MKLKLGKYITESAKWPKKGKQVLAQFSADSVVVYQAYSAEIGLFAAEHQYFDKGFSFNRMSWIKTSFLWMMHRSAWGRKPDQEIILAIYLKRDYFNKILASAYPAKNIYSVSDEEWTEGLQASAVRLQWDPDYDPYSRAQARKTIQLGLRHHMLLPFNGEGIHKIENISDFVSSQKRLLEKNCLEELQIPVEIIYPLYEQTQMILGI